jgi:ankyrin repeat protein
MTDAQAATLVRSACSSDLRDARALLDAVPELAPFDMATACVTGEAEAVSRMLRDDPDAVSRRVPPLDWEPILYACFTRFLRADPSHATRIIDVVRVLLDGGADPNVMWFEDEFRELPIFGASGIANNVELTQLLLDAGADPNETYDDASRIGEALYHATEFADPTCARLLIEAGTLPNRVSYCLGRAIDFGDEAMIAMFLDHGAAPTGAQLRKAVSFYGGKPQLVEHLLAAGAPIDDVSDAGVTALQIAVQHGSSAAADVLIAAGADATRVTSADRAWANAVVTGDSAPVSPSPPVALLDWSVHLGNVTAVRGLLAAGAPVDGDDAVRPIRPIGHACWRGHAGVVRELAASNAALIWNDGSAMGALLHGSLHCHDPIAGPTMRTIDEVDLSRYAATLRVLTEAGAPRPERLWDPTLDIDELVARITGSSSR